MRACRIASRCKTAIGILRIPFRGRERERRYAVKSRTHDTPVTRRMMNRDIPRARARARDFNNAPALSGVVQAGIWKYHAQPICESLIPRAP